eukprot:SAG31_NODE_578_length_13949_cov_5.041372_13_plen_166_part_00
MVAWRGVPYAEPPTGINRWRAPRDKSWIEGGVDATKFGPTCAQFGPGWPSLGGYIQNCSNLDGCPNMTWTNQTSEDCLYLNVYVPRVPTADRARKLPVVVFFPAGGFQWGSSSDQECGGLRRGPGWNSTILVTVNVRLPFMPTCSSWMNGLLVLCVHTLTNGSAG